MPPLWLVALAVGGLLALPASVIVGLVAIRLAEWYWDHRGRRI